MAKTITGSNLIRVMKGGVPAYVAPWYKELTTEGKAMIGAGNNLCRSDDRLRKHYTKVEYVTQLKA